VADPRRTVGRADLGRDPEAAGRRRSDLQHGIGRRRVAGTVPLDLVARFGVGDERADVADRQLGRPDDRRLGRGVEPGEEHGDQTDGGRDDDGKTRASWVSNGGGRRRVGHGPVHVRDRKERGGVVRPAAVERHRWRAGRDGGHGRVFQRRPEGVVPRVDRGEPVLGVEGQAVPERRGELRIAPDPGEELVEPVGVAGFRPGRHTAAEQLDDQRRGRVQVGPLVDRVERPELLGRHVAEGAALHRELEAVGAQHLGHAEVAQHQGLVRQHQVGRFGRTVAFALQQEVRGLEVTVHDAGGVHHPEGGGEVVDDPADLGEARRRAPGPRLVEPGAERAPAGQLHDEVGLAARELTDVVDGDQPLGPQAPQDAGLLDEPGPHVRVEAEVVGQDLDGHRPVEDGVVREQHGGEAAGAQLAADLVPADLVARVPSHPGPCLPGGA
jgi:hypothetical protein